MLLHRTPVSEVAAIVPENKGEGLGSRGEER